jgi:hypothetical protein
MNLRSLSAGLLAVAVSILWMAAGTASATTLVSPAGTVYTGSLVAEAEGHVVLHNPIAKIECASKVEGTVESHGAGVTAGGKISSLSFTGCTDSWHVTVVAAGSLEVHNSGGGNGTVTSSGATVEATRFGVTCRYATSSTDIGTFTGGSPATLDISAGIPFHSGSIFCGSGPTTWTGSYKVTTPTALAVANLEVKRTTTLNAVVGTECVFNKEKENEFCSIKFELVGAGEEAWTVFEKGKLINTVGQFNVTSGCTKGTVLKKAGDNCTDVANNIKKEAAEDTWCVEFEGPIGKGPHCTTLRK